MARWVFVSFLGDSPYTSVVYPDPRDGTRKSAPETPYVQEAFLHYLQEDEISPIVVTLTTPQAADKNYACEGGLAERIQRRGLRALQVDIDPPGDEASLWRTFERFAGVFEEGDRVYFDVTHAFRVLPMLGLVGLNYARALRHIHVEGIWYGEYNFRTGGAATARDVTAFADVQDWAYATRMLRDRGSLRELNTLSGEVIRRGSAESKKGFNRRRAAFDKLRRGLQQLASYFELANAHALEADALWAGVRDDFEALRERYDDAFDPAARPVLDLLDVALRKLSPGMSPAGRRVAVLRWAADHLLIQQGFTMLDETVTTTVCEAVGRDASDKPVRKLVGSYLKIPDVDELRPDAQGLADAGVLITSLAQLPAIAEWRALSRSIAEPRNSLNHAGYDRRGNHLSEGAYRAQLDARIGEYEQMLAETSRAQ